MRISLSVTSNDMSNRWNGFSQINLKNEWLQTY